MDSLRPGKHEREKRKQDDQPQRKSIAQAIGGSRGVTDAKPRR